MLNPRMGLLAPDQRVNVTVDFLPLEERNYTIRLPIKVKKQITNVCAWKEARNLTSLFWPFLIR